MHRGNRSRGYTIVETLIFLAVSAALFVSTMALINGRQGRTEFAQKSREFEIQLQDIANDVTTGYYANTVDSSGQFISCTAGLGVAGTVQLSRSATDKQGSNQNCVFVGRTLQLNPDGDTSTYKVHTLVGKRTVDGSALGIDSSKLAETKAVVIAPGPASPADFPDLSQSKQVAALTFGCILTARTGVSSLTLPADKPCTNPPANAFRTDAISFVTTFVGSSDTSTRDSGDTQVDVYARDSGMGAVIGRNSTLLVKEINDNYATESDLTPSPGVPLVKNPAAGIYICLSSTGSNQFGLLRLGGSGSLFSTDLTIQKGSCL